MCESAAQRTTFRGDGILRRFHPPINPGPRQFDTFLSSFYRIRDEVRSEFQLSEQLAKKYLLYYVSCDIRTKYNLDHKHFDKRNNM